MFKKILIIGDSKVGKTCIFNNVVGSGFRKNYYPTIIVNYEKLTMDKDIIIWDTAGKEKFYTMITKFYPGTDIFIIVYDINNRQSFRSIITWYHSIETVIDHEMPNICIGIFGNKNDSEVCHRQVSYKEGVQFADENQFMFFEGSARDNSTEIESFVNALIHESDCKKDILTKRKKKRSCCQIL